MRIQAAHEWRTGLDRPGAQEFGIALPLKAEVVRREACNRLEDLPGYANTVIGDLLSELRHLDERIKQYDLHIRAMAKDCTAAQQLMQLSGVRETTATAIVAMVGNAREFDTGRQFAAKDRPGAGAVLIRSMAGFGIIAVLCAIAS